MMKVCMAIASAKPGMRLASAVQDDAGRVLVPEGAVLTESLLHGLERRGVVELCIEQVLDEDPAALEARRARISQALARRFRQAGDGFGTLTLRQAIFDFRMERGE